jgi:DNA modification methylase
MRSDLSKYVNRIVHGDALQVLKRIPSNSIHMAITSPPYNIGVNYDTYKDDLEYGAYLGWLKEIWKQTKRVLVDGGRFALNIAPTSISSFRPVHHDTANDLRDIGMIMRTEIIWYKQSMRKRTAWGSWKSPSNPHIIPSWEYVMVFSKNSWRLDGEPDKADILPHEFETYSDGFWHIPPERVRNGHPAPFPEDLVYRLIKFYTYRENVVLDMFGGTGTVAYVAMKTGRKYIHIDISEDYCETALKRLEKLGDNMRSQTTLDAHHRIESTKPKMLLLEAQG